jgi:predicted Zn-dependent peptidase
MTLPFSQVVSLGVLVKVGTRDEVWPEEAGLAHALEHMLFQGTENFPTSLDLTAHVERVGGDLNAFTSSEFTFFHATVPAGRPSRACDVLVEQILRPRFPSKQIGPEMGNITQEIREKVDSPTDHVSRQARELFFDGHPLGRNTLGTETSVQSFTQGHFRRFWEKWYGDANLVFIAVGNISPESALRAFAQGFSGRSDGGESNHRPPLIAELPSSTPGSLHRIKREIKQVHGRLSWLGPPSFRWLECSAMTTLSVMAGGGKSFPLFQEIRNRLGLCYSIGISFESFSDVGQLTVRVATDPNRYEQALEAIRQVMRRLREDQKLFEIALEARLGKESRRYESAEQILRRAAWDIVRGGRPLGFEEQLAQILRVTFDEVVAAADKFVNPDASHVVLLGPLS